MKLLACITLLTSMTAPNPQGAPTMTFDEALSLAAARTAVSSNPLQLEADAVRRARIPDVRVEVAGNTSRTLDPYTAGPLDQLYATSVLAADYPLWDGGATTARIRAVQTKLRRAATRTAMDDARFNELLNAFGDLYLAQRQSGVIRPVYDRFSADEQHVNELLARGDMSNLTAADRRELVLGFESRLLEIEARRIDALSKIRLLTGVQTEPILVLDTNTTAPAEVAVADDAVKATGAAVESARARMVEVKAQAGWRAILSAFAGAGAGQSEIRRTVSNGSFGIYGARVFVSYPLFRGTSTLAEAEARADFEEMLSMQRAAVENAQLRAQEYRYQEQIAEKRRELLTKSVEAARLREESLQRLVSAGMRQESDLAQAQAERIRREADLLAIEIERWKAAQLLARMTAAGGESRGSE